MQVSSTAPHKSWTSRAILSMSRAEVFLDGPIGPALERSIMKQLTLTPTQSKLVTSLVRASTSSHSVVQRGSLILDYAQSGNVSQVASKHGIGRGTVRLAGVIVGKAHRQSLIDWKPSTK